MLSDSFPDIVCNDDGLPCRPVGQWSLEKLDYVHRYTGAFLKATKERRSPGKWRSVNFINLCSGPGMCKVDEPLTYAYGSPLIAINQPIKFDHYYFCDNDHDCMTSLESRCSQHNRSMFSFFEGDANEKVKEIVKDLRNQDAVWMNGVWPTMNFAFIDPEGFEIRWTTIEELAKVTKMDLLIYYPQEGIVRQMKKEFESTGHSCIDDYFGTDSWRSIYEKNIGKRATSLTRELIDLYKANLQKLGYENWQFSEPKIMNDRNITIYRLIFASKHELGAKIWKSINSCTPYGQRTLPI